MRRLPFVFSCPRGPLGGALGALRLPYFIGAAASLPARQRGDALYTKQGAPQEGGPLLSQSRTSTLFISAARGAPQSTSQEAPCGEGAPSCCCREPPASSNSSWGQKAPELFDGGPLAPSGVSQRPAGAEGTTLAAGVGPCGGPVVDIGTLVAAAERAAARGCGCCPFYWQQTAAAVAAAAYNLTWHAGGHGALFRGPLLGAPPPQIALPLVRPLLRLNVRLSAAIGTAADEASGDPPWGPQVALRPLPDMGRPEAPVSSFGAPRGPQGALIQMLELCRETVGALLEAVRCALRGASRHEGGPQGGIMGAPLSVRELAAIAAAFRGPRRALLLLYNIETPRGPPGGPLEGPPGPPYSVSGALTSSSGDVCGACTQGKGPLWGPPGAPHIAAWGRELLDLYQETIGGLLLLALGAPQRPRLPPGALTGSLWRPLNRVPWVGRGGGPTGTAGAQDLLLRDRISLPGLLQLLAAFEGPVGGPRGAPLDGSLAPPTVRDGGAPNGAPIPHLGAPLALLHLLERQIWTAQGDWGAPMEAPIRQTNGPPPISAVAARQQQQQRQQQQEQAAEGIEVERLVFAAAVLAEARAAGGPPKGPQGPFFLVSPKQRIQRSTL